MSAVRHKGPGQRREVGLRMGRDGNREPEANGPSEIRQDGVACPVNRHITW